MMAQLEDEPLVLACMRCSYMQLRQAIQRINFGTDASPKFLPMELTHQVASFVTVERVKLTEVEAVAASSHDSTHKLADCLVNDEETWWLSGFGSMPGGIGQEYVEFKLCERPILRRVRAVYVRIPPLPLGPLSVRNFRVDTSDENGIWNTLPLRNFRVDNRSCMQRFETGEVDAHSIRVVCLSNQISAFLGTMESPHRMEQVGFYSVQFE